MTPPAHVVPPDQDVLESGRDPRRDRRRPHLGAVATTLALLGVLAWSLVGPGSGDPLGLRTPDPASAPAPPRVPELRGLDEAAARERLSVHGLGARVIYVPARCRNAGLVVAQQPAPAQRLSAAAEVSLLVTADRSRTTACRR